MKSYNNDLKEFENLINKMDKYSKNKNAWEFASPLDISRVDKNILENFKKNPELALINIKKEYPLILFCIECGMEESVIWYIKQGKNLDICDNDKNNIALLAHKYNNNKVLALCAENQVLSEWKNNNGINLKYLLEKDAIRKKSKQEQDENIL